MNSENSWRYTTLGLLLTAFAVFVAIQVLRIQLSPQAEVFRNRGEAYSGNWRTLVPARGQIYDRWGHLLAGNTTVYEVGAELVYVQNPSTIALALNAVTGSEYDQVFALASQEPSEDAVYARLADFVTEEQKAKLEQLAAEMQTAYGKSKEKERPSMAGLRYTPIFKAHRERFGFQHSGFRKSRRKVSGIEGAV
jgi:cell division protein FtsI/penicillin-binding protein 2